MIGTAKEERSGEAPGRRHDDRERLALYRLSIAKL